MLGQRRFHTAITSQNGLGSGVLTLWQDGLYLVSVGHIFSKTTRSEWREQIYGSLYFLLPSKICLPRPSLQEIELAEFCSVAQTDLCDSHGVDALLRIRLRSDGPLSAIKPYALKVDSPSVDNHEKLVHYGSCQSGSLLEERGLLKEASALSLLHKDHFMQTKLRFSTACLKPGFSGGAVLSSRGHLLGVNVGEEPSFLPSITLGPRTHYAFWCPVGSDHQFKML